MWIANYASANGDTGRRECATREEAEYWCQLWERSGGRVAYITAPAAHNP